MAVMLPCPRKWRRTMCGGARGRAQPWSQPQKVPLVVDAMAIHACLHVPDACTERSSCRGAGSVEDTSGARVQQQSSDSSSDSDYDEQLARKIKQRNSYQVRAVEQALTRNKASLTQASGVSLKMGCGRIGQRPRLIPVGRGGSGGGGRPRGERTAADAQRVRGPHRGGPHRFECRQAGARALCCSHTSVRLGFLAPACQESLALTWRAVGSRRGRRCPSTSPRWRGA